MNKPDKRQIHIGIDFDNTIVIYDDVFYKYASNLSLILPNVAKNKQVIRDAIRLLPEGNKKWTELQGLVYGYYMDEAKLAEGFEKFLKECYTHSIKISIISHKTFYPAMGPRVNLHEAARRWIENKSFFSKYELSENDIIFEENLEGKLNQIKTRGCTHFIDDLPEVLFHVNFPSNVGKILYLNKEENRQNVLFFKDWNEIKKYFIKSLYR